jgi:DNA-binding NarL/FixJ family response regulator
MDKESYDAAQQGLLVCLLGEDHEQRLAAFLGGLRHDPHWSQREIDGVETTIRDMLSGAESADWKSVAVNGKTPLSRREEEVLRLLARGYTGKEIAARFKLSSKTVETYKVRSYTKLGLTGRPDLIRYALERGWLDDPWPDNGMSENASGNGQVDDLENAPA